MQKTAEMAVTNYTVGSGAFTWTDIVAPTEADMKKVSKTYNLHHYTLRDCLEPDHLPKSEELGNIRFIITRILLGKRNDSLHTIQQISTKLAIFYNDTFIITVHRLPQPFLETIRGVCTDPAKCLSTRELVTHILWHVLHSYDQPAIALSDEVDAYEAKIFRQSLTPAMMQDLHFMKQRASVCLKLLRLTGEVINSIRTAGGDSVALQDVRDLHIKLIMLYEQAHEDVTNLLNIYLSLSSQKTNQVIQVLTLFSIFFLPITFIVGVYGMNFEFMPELKAKWGYPAVMIFMAIVTLFVYIWFKRKKWM
ncbi:MAG TPA: CorA family divalent cation transporter [Bacteroidales bacterium]|nr:CorA family divalent cation transporter [Bacteroidales bacterium]HPS50578.1 CorA family divalent cation transporter [Bacteroidales bacterium]